MVAIASLVLSASGEAIWDRGLPQARVLMKFGAATQTLEEYHAVHDHCRTVAFVTVPVDKHIMQPYHATI